MTVPWRPSAVPARSRPAISAAAVNDSPFQLIVSTPASEQDGEQQRQRRRDEHGGGARSRQRHRDAVAAQRLDPAAAAVRAAPGHDARDARR